MHSVQNLTLHHCKLGSAKTNDAMFGRQHVINFDMPKEIENYVHRWLALLCAVLEWCAAQVGWHCARVVLFSGDLSGCAPLFRSGGALFSIGAFLFLAG